MAATEGYDALAARYRQEVLSKLPPNTLLPSNLQFGSDVSEVPDTCGKLTAKQIEITKMDSVSLLEKMASQELTAEEVTLAFGTRATIAHQLVCCLTDIWLDEALVKARALDEHLKTTGKVVGPLHGLPISLKDQYSIKGKITSMSFSAHQAKPNVAPADAHLAQILSDAGAVFYCHTTLPQTIMHLECESFWGRTLNPYNTALTSGGSSGGEGALVAIHGSPLGIGTDIGGSVRSPAANCGLYGLRPTTLRLPGGGCQTYVPGRDSILGTGGPMCHSARDIELLMSIACGSVAAPWLKDPSLVDMPWRSSRKGEWQIGGGGRKLRIGVMWDDGEVRPIQAIRKAMEGLVKKLKESDEVEVVDFAPWKSREGWHLIRQLYFPDATRRIRSLLAETGEPLHPLTKWLAEEAGPPLKDFSNLHDLWELNIQRDAFRAGFLKHWVESQVDVVLCPNAPQPAPKHNHSKWWVYTSHWNLVDYPGVVFPYGPRVNAQDPVEPELEPALSEDEKIMRAGYSAVDSHNAPVCLQLVAKKYRDEELLDALAVVERLGRES